MKKETSGCLSKTKGKRTKKAWAEKMKGWRRRRRRRKRGGRVFRISGYSILFEGV